MRTTVRTLEEAEQAIRDQRTFRLQNTRTLWGTTEAPTFFGRIPARHSVGAEEADYWVFSYDTLIAWVTEGEPTVPDVGYSPTTGQHQYLAAHALGVDFRPARGRDTVEIPRNDSLYGRARRLRRGGMDGAVPERPESRSNGTVPRESAYAGTSGDAMHWNTEGSRSWGSIVTRPEGWRSRSHP